MCGELARDLRRIGVEEGRPREGHRGERGARHVGGEHDGPEAQQLGHAGDAREHERDRRERVLGKELVAPEHDQQEARRVEQVAQDGAPRLGRDGGARHEREADREARREAREEQQPIAPHELLVGRSDEALEDLVGREEVADGVPGGGGAALGAVERDAQAFLVHAVGRHGLLIPQERADAAKERGVFG